MRVTPKKADQGPTTAFTLVELLVVIAIMTLLISLLLPALARARQEALTIGCLANLRSIGQIQSEYLSTYHGTFPCGTSGWDSAANDYYGSWRSWLVSYYVGGSSLPNSYREWNDPTAYAKYEGLFWCPVISEEYPQVDNSKTNNSALNYAANPWLYLYFNGTNCHSLFNETQVQSPVTCIEIADGYINPSQPVNIGSSCWYCLDGWNNYRNAPITTVIGLTGLGTANGPYNWLPDFRHDQNSGPSSGVTNMVYVDGHAASVPVNGYRVRNVLGEAPEPNWLNPGG